MAGIIRSAAEVTPTRFEVRRTNSSAVFFLVTMGDNPTAEQYASARRDAKDAARGRSMNLGHFDVFYVTEDGATERRTDHFVNGAPARI